MAGLIASEASALAGTVPETGAPRMKVEVNDKGVIVANDVEFAEIHGGVQ